LGSAPGSAAAEAQQADRAAQARQRQTLSKELEATILRTDYGTLVLPIWYGEDAQFVPGQMAANDLQIVVPGVGESATAWELSPTDVSRLVDSSRVAGGRQVGLRKFDMTSALLFTDDPRLIERLQAKVVELREPAARVAVDLARTKLDRVNNTVITLQAMRPQPDAPLVLSRAREMLRRAELFLQEGRFHDARLAAADSLQLSGFCSDSTGTTRCRRFMRRFRARTRSASRPCPITGRWCRGFGRRVSRGRGTSCDRGILKTSTPW
jgi:hypothetical protein